MHNCSFVNRFLSTLERHLKNVAYGANFSVVIDTLPSLMNALRMVWIISRHYNRDERMVPLMERIAWELCQRVMKTIRVDTIFKYKRGGSALIVSSYNHLIK